MAPIYQQDAIMFWIWSHKYTVNNMLQRCLATVVRFAVLGTKSCNVALCDENSHASF